MNKGVEFETSTHPVAVHRHCIKDGCHGEMMTTGMGMGNNFGTRWTHECSVCGDQASYDKQYPCVEFRDGAASVLPGQPI